MSKAFKWPKLPNSRPYLDKGYTSIQMREYAMKCIGEAIRNKQWVGLTLEEKDQAIEGCRYMDEFSTEIYADNIEAKWREKNCGQ